MKRCNDCNKELSRGDFNRNPSAPDGREYSCRKCSSKRAREKYALNYEENYRRKKDDKLRRRYGITLQHYEDMLKRQNGKCAICGGVSEDRSLSVDHCHDSGTVRGLLCDHCNFGIGKFSDDVSVVKKVIEYLQGAYTLHLSEEERQKIRSSKSALKTHCKNGHAFTDSNTYVSPKGWRVCKECKRRRLREYRARNRM